MTNGAARKGGARVPILLSSLLFFLLPYLLLRFAIEPPMPSSVLGMYMFFIGVAILLYVSSDEQRFDAFKAPLISLMVAPERRLLRLALGVLLPVLASSYAYTAAQMELAPPVHPRSIHPAPPSLIDFKGKSIDILSVENPFRHLEEEDHQGFQEHVARGRDVYYENCVLCHGDNLEGDGLYAHGLDPIPANLADPGTIAQLQESYLFWRIAKGGPGLPVEGAPWDSAMPAWEKFLDEDQIWEVILFLYDFTGARPRSWEE